jgi:D-alanine-D-alanine ligase-like ATP-grasp enzyme
MADAPPLSPSLVALAQVCREEGYLFSIIDDHSQQLVRVADGEHFFFAGIGRVANYPLNTAVAASVARDKAFVYQVLAKAGIAVPDYGHFFLEPMHQGLRGKERERTDAFVYAERLGYPVFVKPIDGSKGTLCDIAYDLHDLHALLERIARFHHAALIQRVLAGEDRRLFVIDGKVIYGYRRLRAVLQGDGKNPIKTLLERYNAEVTAQGVSAVKPDSPFLRETLRARGLSLEHVLRLGEEIQASPRGNISAGGSLLDYTEEVPAVWADWAERVTAALGLRVCAIDFFAEPHFSRVEELHLIEVNSNPNLDGLMATGREARVRAIWRQVARTYFDECRARART